MEVVRVKIINNKIYIVKGETPTYDVSVVDSESEAPFILPKGVINPVVEFIVRPSVYNREDEFAFRMYMDFSKHKKFDETQYDLGDYNKLDTRESPAWDDTIRPNSADANKLFKRTIGTVVDYRYYENNKWVPYEFRLLFKFPYEATSKMESKQYKYEVTLFGADELLYDGDTIIGLNVIHDKYPLLEATDFNVGGSLSE